MKHGMRPVLFLLAISCTPSFGAEAGVAAYSRIVAAEPSLVARWRFEDDCRDVKGRADGTARGGRPVFCDGPNGGKALLLADRRFVTMGPAPTLDLSGITIELWFRPMFAAPPGYNPCLIAKRKSSPETRFSIHIWGDYSCMAFWNGKQVVTFAPAGRPLQRGEWYYLVVTCVGDDLKMYLDGLRCEPTSPIAGFSFEARDLPLNLGSSTPEGVEHFEGTIDEVAIYSKVLSVEDVEHHMDAMGAKQRITREQVAAEAEKRRIERERIKKERLGGLMSDENLLARGETRVYSGEHLGAIRLPVGGIGTGSIQMNGRASRPVWQIFNNLSQPSVPNSFFGVRIKPPGGQPTLRALQTAAVGPFVAMKELSFRGEYPFGWYRFQDPDLPVRFTLEVFNPLVPLDVRSSSIPCSIYSITVTNPGHRPAEVTLLAAQQNAVGFTGKGEIRGRAFAGYGSNRNRVLRTDRAAILHMAADGSPSAPGHGDMALAVLDPQASASALWNTLETLAADVADDGALGGPSDAGPSSTGQTIDGALASRFILDPGEQRTVSFLLSWYFPNAVYGQGAWGGRGNMYANWWSDAMDVAHELIDRLDELTRLSRGYHDALYASNLPRWLLDRIGSQVVVLRSQTCFWTKSGYFGGWEGCGCTGGCCAGNCNHVWQYAQAHARLFPQIGRIMREQAFRFQSSDGAIPHRQPASHPAFDGQCGDILGAYREHLLSPDGAWLARHWPSIKKAMDFTIATWDKDEDGVLAGPQWNTLDGNLGGSTSWLGTLYLAALSASQRMATIEGDGDAAKRYLRIREAGCKKQDQTLFNGEYYIQIPDPKPQQDYGNGCHIDQVLGQWWAHQLGLGWLYPTGHVRTALQSLFRYNLQMGFAGIKQLPRKFVADEDAGMQMITWPKGDRPPKHMLYADEVMSGFEYSAAAMMVYAGLLKEGLAVVRAAYDRYDGRLRTGLTPGDSASWGYSGNPFCDDECGKFYARPMSVWSMLLACQGFIFDGPAGLIGFKPIWRPEDHRSFFTAAEGWGLFTQTRAAGKQTERIELRYGKLRLKSMVFELPPETKPDQGVKAAVRVGPRSLPATPFVTRDELRVQFDAPIVLDQNSAIDVALSWR
jgi:non-lysosomal glucosylceramidase